MYLKSLELSGFKSFAKKTELHFNTPITSIVGPNGSGKSNVAEAFSFVLGEQSIKSLRGKRGEDLIFNGSKTMPRLNRAAVKITLDNSRKLLNIDFDEVTIERVVHRDNNNEYLINGSQVRLKDIVEILAGAHMGPTGHHIISQGEADRILNANLKERRLMIEDALGLKIYQYKRAESERKLEKTKENVAQVESLRRELAPHLRFLHKQVEKIEKAKALREELAGKYAEYLSIEDAYLKKEKEALTEEKKAPTNELHELERKLSHAKSTLERSHSHDDQSAKVLQGEKDLRDIRQKKDELVREAGRLEGEISSETRRLNKLLEKAKEDSNKSVQLSEVKLMTTELDRKLDSAMQSDDVSLIRKIITEIKSSLTVFLKRFETADETDATKESEDEIERIKAKKEIVLADIEKQTNLEIEAQEEYGRLRTSIEQEKDKSRDAEREIFQIMAAQNEIRAKLGVLQAREERLKSEQEEFERELREARVLVGDLAFSENSQAADESRQVQNERRRLLEKMKIRLEELGGAAGEDVLKEYKEASERDSYLEREISDLEVSSNSLEQLIRELTDKLDLEFKSGVNKINIQFEEFFKLMFGGGHASLLVVKQEKRRKSEEEELLEVGEEPTEEEEPEEGIDITVNLPHKKIRSLEMLSGGERALTSIALLFAISQVNPPPFIVLDETDAALDEANSKKYGDMIENLSKYSQLVVITHNRETMSRAGVLYGVTMGQEAVSKLLSIQFEEAVQVAK